MSIIKKNINIFIVTRKRLHSLDRLLSSLSRSLNLSNTKACVYLGIEVKDYKKIKEYKNIKITKVEFPLNTDPIYIKNFLYKTYKSTIKIFLDDDTEVQANFIKRLLIIYKSKKNCFLYFNPVARFTLKQKRYFKSNCVCCIGFAEFGENKFKKIIELPFVGEDTELSNRINFKKYDIFSHSELDIKHNIISNSDRNSNRLILNGISNTIEILRSYGAIKNFFSLNSVIYYSIFSSFVSKNTIYLKPIIHKLFYRKLSINFFGFGKTLIPPIHDYFFNHSNKLKKNKFLKKRKYKKHTMNLVRLDTFERYQINEVFFNRKFKINHIGPSTDINKISKKTFFCKFNKSDSSLNNLINFLDHNKDKDVFFIPNSKDIQSLNIFYKLNHIKLIKIIMYCNKVFFIKDKNIFEINKLELILFLKKNILFAPIISIFSIIISIVLILPIKIKT